MDVRYSAEERALRDSVVSVVERLGPRSVQDLADAGRAGRLNDAVESSGWRELRTATAAGGPLATGVDVAIVAEELARGLADVPFLGPTLASELRRCVGDRESHPNETVALTPDLSQVACVVDPADAPALVAVDAARSDRASDARVAGRRSRGDDRRPHVSFHLGRPHPSVGDGATRAHLAHQRRGAGGAR